MPTPLPLARRGRRWVLTINGGSSSLKFALFGREQPLSRGLSGRIERIGQPNARFSVKETERGLHVDCLVDAPDQSTSLTLLTDWLEASVGFASVAVIGHRVVYGGERYHDPELVTREVIEQLRKYIPYDPEHMPGELEAIESFERRFPELPQVVCFDTSFHHDMPRVAQIVPIPRRFEAKGVRRYGFHGLSYQYLMQRLKRIAGPEEALGRVILAHLGTGASLAAVDHGQAIDTTMGFTPASGLVMGTRTGDIDPGLVRFLQQTQGMTPDEFDGMVNRESGLRGISESSSDIRDLLSSSQSDSRAAEAIDVFCYQIKKWIGAYAAVLGGLDVLVFSGGIGENAPEIRRKVCDDLGFLGMTLDDPRNEAGDPLISTAESAVKVRVIRTDEESMIAEACLRLVADPG
jgi:acetate kinase